MNDRWQNGRGRTVPGAWPIPLARPVGRRAVLRGGAFAAIGLTLAACSPESQSISERLSLYNWENYIGKTTLADFQKASGIRVQASYFNSTEELFQRLSAAPRQFDVIVPPSDLVPRLRAANLLAPLNLDKIPNFANIDPAFQSADYDPAPRRTVPYSWLVVGIGYRKSRVNGVPDSWKWLYDSDLYKGHLALFANPAMLIRIGAKYLGKSLNGIDAETVEQVTEMLIRQKPNIRLFHHDNGEDLLLSGEVDIVMEFNGDIAQVAQEDPDIGFVVPDEGSLLIADTLAISRGSDKIDLAHKFINFLLDGEVGKGIAETILYPTPNATAKALMPEDYRDNSIIFPVGDGMDASEWGAPLSDEDRRIFDAAVTRIEAA